MKKASYKINISLILKTAATAHVECGHKCYVDTTKDVTSTEFIQKNRNCLAIVIFLSPIRLPLHQLAVLKQSQLAFPNNFNSVRRYMFQVIIFARSD